MYAVSYIQIADVERVTREIKILKKARHDNVIQLFEVIDSTSQIFLVMEYLDGGEVCCTGHGIALSKSLFNPPAVSCISLSCSIISFARNASPSKKPGIFSEISWTG